MCYSSGALQRFNPVGRILGDKYKTVDPLMAASERKTDAMLTRSFDPQQSPAQTYNTPGAPLPDTPMSRRRPASDTILTGGNLGTPASTTGTGLTLLGG